MSKAPISNAPMANAPAPPGYYNSLDGSLVQAWALLTRGVADRRAPFHTPTIATVDAQGSPHVRTIVLRACDPASRLLRFHTDVRGERWSTLLAIPASPCISTTSARNFSCAYRGAPRS